MDFFAEMEFNVSNIEMHAGSHGDGFDGTALVTFSTTHECEKFLQRFKLTQMQPEHMMVSSIETDLPEILEERMVEFHQPSDNAINPKPSGGKRVRKRGGGRFKCPLCHYQFQHNWRLNSHITDDHNNLAEKKDLRKTTKPQPFQCPHCHRKFAENARRNYHIKSAHKA